MQQLPHKAEPTDRQTKCDTGETFSERQLQFSDIDVFDSPFFTEAFQTAYNREEYEFSDVFNLQYVDVDGPNLSHNSNVEPRYTARLWDAPQISNTAVELSALDDNDLGSASNNKITPSNANYTHRKSASVADRSFEPMRLIAHPSSRHSSAPPQVGSTTGFGPFRRLFHTSEQAKLHRRERMHFDRRAYRENDPSIPDIELNRQRHVGRIYDAMIRGDLARDNRKSVAIKRWTREPHYPSDLVEAYAHKVFDCLLEQAKEGFRGWHHNDYVIDDRKGDDDDRDIDCAGRLNNVISALEQEKTICEDIMTSACQIRMFVNAPKAYANRKHQNRIGNSKRPNTGVKEDLALDVPPSKMRKTRGRRGRGRSSTRSDVFPSRSITLQQSHPVGAAPYFLSSSLQRSNFRPTANDHIPTQPRSIYSSSSITQRDVASASQPLMSSGPMFPIPAPSSLHNPLPSGLSSITSMPSFIQSQLMQPNLSRQPCSAPATPDNVILSGTNFALDSWQQFGSSSDSAGSMFPQPSPADQPLLSPPEWWHDPQLVPYFENTGSANFFEEFADTGVSLADIENPSLPRDRGNSSRRNTSNAVPNEQPELDQSLFEDFLFE